MNRLIRILSIVLLFILVYPLNAQDKKIDSLENRLKYDKIDDTIKVKLRQATELKYQKENVLLVAETKQLKIIIVSLIGALILMLLLIIFILRLHQLKNKTNVSSDEQRYKTEEKNNEYITLNEEYVTLNEELRSSNELLYHAKNLIEERESLLIQIADNIPIFISLLNKDLEYTFVNKEYAKVFNWQKEEITGKKVKDILDKEAYENAYPYLIKTLEGQIVKYENVLHFKDSKQRIIQTTYIPYYQNNEIKGIIVCNIDITERKKADNALKASEEKLSLLIKNSNDIIVLVNEKGEQYFISNVAERLTGYTVDELLGSIQNVIYPDDLDIVRQHWERVSLFKNAPDIIQYRHKHKEKGYVWFEAVAQNFLDNPAINAIVANVRDITERKNIEQALKESEEEKAKLMVLEIERINNELESNQKAMTAATLKLIQNSGRDTQTIEQLMDIEKNTNPEGKKSINMLISNYKRLSYNSNWDEFETLFEKVHSSFYEKLNAQFPHLTPNERKICAFLKLNMSSKDIAQITFQSDDALKKARLRLRQKLAINRETNLVAFLQNI